MKSTLNPQRRAGPPAVADLVSSLGLLTVRTKRLVALVPLTAVLLLFAAVSQCVWLPDVFLPRAHVLAAASSGDGHRFQVVQYWNGSDFYTTEVEDLRPDGQLAVAQIDWDDNKHWSGTIQVVESDKKLVITFPRDSRVFEYRWDLGVIVAPYDRRDIPFVLHTQERARLTKSGQMVRRTQSFTTQAASRLDSEP